MKSLNSYQFAKQNIKNKPWRSYGMMLLTGILCFILFMSSFLIISLKSGMTSLSNRMGADIIVVPEGYDSNISGAILRGEPNTFFFDQSVAERIKTIEGVENVSPQLFLATLSAGCCSFPIQIIGVDFDDDFVVVPWLESQIKLPLQEGEIVVGNNIVGDYQHNVKFFNEPYSIKGKLAKTGMGFDNSVFMSLEATRKLAKEYEKILQTPVSNGDNLISSVMIKVEKGKDVKEVYQAIGKEFEGEGIYPLLSKNMMNEVSNNIKSLRTYIYLLIGLIWGLAFFVLSLVYSISMKERKREFATLRILGATKKKLLSICLWEIFLVSFVGAFGGTLLSFIVALLFGSALSETLKMPFLTPDILTMLLILCTVFVIGSALGPIASAISLHKMQKREMGLLLRENE